jgi:hypothetical protein
MRDSCCAFVSAAGERDDAIREVIAAAVDNVD